jgi:CHAT domain-containing protein/tetratricopeptide (TPR) repeat protein
LADRAVLDLIGGQFPRAVTALEQASDWAPSNAALYSDLAAADLELATATNQHVLLIRALASTDRALTLAPSLREARFNRAVALEKLHLRVAARSEWDRYLALDAHSAWADEAARRRKQLDAPSCSSTWRTQESELAKAAARGDRAEVAGVVRRFPQPARLYTEERFLREFPGKDVQTSKVLLGQIILIADALREQGGDEMLSLATAAALKALPSEPERLAWVRAQQRFGVALTEFRTRRFSNARPLFGEALDLLSRTGNPFSHWADFYIAVCDYQAADYDQALHRLVSLKGRAEEARFPILSGRIQWMIGLIAVVRGNLADALHAYRQAATQFEKTGEQENLAAIYSLEAQNLEFLGDERDSWRYRLQALSREGEILDPLRRQGLFQGAAIASLEASAPTSALAFQEEAVAAAQAAAKADLIAESFLRRAVIFEELGRLDLAAADLRHAAVAIAQVDDPVLRRIVEVESQVVDVKRQLTRNPRTAVDSLTHILEEYRQTHFLRQIASIHLLRAEGYLKLHQDGPAEADLRIALDLLERESTEVDDLGLRSFFLDLSRSTFDTIIEFYVDRGNVKAALEYLERSRAQCLLTLGERFAPPALARSRRPGVASRALSPQALQSALPSGVVLLEFAVLKTRILAWTITRERILLTATPCAQSRLTGLVARLNAAMQGEVVLPQDASRVSAEAFDLLIRPVLYQLSDATEVILIPDRVLFRVPFAALRDTQSGQFLLELYRLGQAPSATAYLQSLVRLRGISTAPPEAAVVVGNPSLGRSSLLPDLAAAEEEAREIAAQYSHAVLFVGPSATKSAVYTAAAYAEVLHIAAHGLAEEDSDPESGILFAPEAGTAAPRPRPEFSRVQLVYLSACETARGRLSESEGALSPARFFLGAGVPTVIASLWKVDDRGARDLALAFHSRLRQGAGALAALQQAQIELLHKGTSARVWAAFVAVGADNAKRR